MDFGTGALIVIPDGSALPIGAKSRRRRTHVLRVVLSHSRKGYSEVMLRQTAEDFLRALENAFEHFGGVPRTIVTDNPQGRGAEGRLVRSRTQPEACRLRRALRHGGPAHAPVHAPAQGQGRARRWLRAGQRPQGADVHQSGGAERLPPAMGSRHGRHAHPRHDARQVGKIFHEVEKPALLPLPAEQLPAVPRSPRVSTATVTSRWTRATTPCRRSSSDERCGSDGTAALCASSIRTCARSRCMPATSPVASPRSPRTSRPRSAGASNTARPGG
ncbi:MAG: hypothetical protein HS102_17685 [Planctomycetia bacterium]|nr:hypothetical protein [Planctomycetia bacterium]